MIVMLIFILWGVIFKLWIPEKRERLEAEKKIITLKEGIAKYNLSEKKYLEKIEQYKKEVKVDENYHTWAKTSVPADMLKLLHQ